MKKLYMGDFLPNRAFDELNAGQIEQYYALLPAFYECGLCEGRHAIPVKDYIFPGTLNPLDYAGMREMAENAIPADCTRLVVYVTGLTCAMLAVVSVCVERGISLTAMHYDRESGKYLPQVVTGEEFYMCGR